MRFLVVTLAVASLALAGCVAPANQLAPAGESSADGPATASFDRALPDVISGLEVVAESEVPSGAGIWVHGNYAYVSGLSSGFHIVDVSDPESPVVVSSIADDFFSRDADVLEYPDGRIVAVLAGQSQGMHFVDVTDPTAPVVLATVETDALGGSGVHNVAVVPGTLLVYNSGSGGKGDDIDVVDATDPANPEVVAAWGTHGCHDITFFMSEDKQRAYCPGIEETQIWDITDPLDGKLVAAVTNPFVNTMGAVTGEDRLLGPGLHHLALVNEDASLLIVGDEFQGGRGPGCGKQASGPDTPLGALWFYDITDEANPVLKGWISADAPADQYADAAAAAAANANPFGAAFGLSCTTHFGALVPGKDMIATAWYRAGVVLVDFSNPEEPTIVDQWNAGTNTWDVRFANGYLFTGDMARGLDVLTFV